MPLSQRRGTGLAPSRHSQHQAAQEGVAAAGSPAVLTKGTSRWSAAQKGPVAPSAAICSPGAASPPLEPRCFAFMAWMEEWRDVCGAEPCLQPPRGSIQSIQGFLGQERHQISSVGERAGTSPFFNFMVFLAPASLCAFRGSKPQPNSSPHGGGHRLIAHPAAAGCPHTGAPLAIITINDVCTLWQVSEGAAPESAIWNTLLDDGEAACPHVHCCCVCRAAPARRAPRRNAG